MPISARNLQDTGVGPLRKYYGDVASISDPPEERQGTSGTYSVVVFRLSNVEVIQSTEPYAYPVAEFSISLSNRKKSRWGFFADSLVKFLKPEEDVKDIVGRRVGLVYTDGVDGRPAPKKTWDRRADEGKGAEVPSPAWEIFEVVGVQTAGSASDGLAEVKKLLDGKSLAEFNKAVFAIPAVKADANLQRSITDRSLVNTLVQMGEFNKDANDIYHKVK
jgi:hypothetical protein